VDLADVLNSQLVSFETDAVARVKNRVESVGACELRKTRFLTGCGASKEILKSFIEPPQGALSSTEMDCGKPLIVISFIFKPAGLIDPRNCARSAIRRTADVAPAPG
jgi:hypothetical protein